MTVSPSRYKPQINAFTESLEIKSRGADYSINTRSPTKKEKEKTPLLKLKQVEGKKKSYS